MTNQRISSDPEAVIKREEKSEKGIPQRIRMHKSTVFFFLILLTTGILSCDEKRVFDEYESLNGWHKDSLVTFQISGVDTTKQYNLFINIRNDNQYRYSNLFLITKIQFPKGKVISDTLEYNMARPNGEWLGTGFGDIKESKLWFKEGVRFSENGDYQFIVQQAMRQNGEENGIERLEGITDVGFRIEKREE